MGFPETNAMTTAAPEPISAPAAINLKSIISSILVETYVGGWFAHKVVDAPGEIGEARVFLAMLCAGRNDWV